MNYKTGDIVLVEIIFADRTGIKKRPAVIICSQSYIKARDDIIVAPITSNIKRTLLGDTKIKEWERAGLLRPSQVVGIFQTIHSSLIERKLGKLADKDLQTAKINLRKTLAL